VPAPAAQGADAASAVPASATRRTVSRAARATEHAVRAAVTAAAPPASPAVRSCHRQRSGSAPNRKPCAVRAPRSARGVVALPSPVAPEIVAWTAVAAFRPSPRLLSASLPGSPVRQARQRRTRAPSPAEPDRAARAAGSVSPVAASRPHSGVPRRGRPARAGRRWPWGRARAAAARASLVACERAPRSSPAPLGSGAWRTIARIQHSRNDRSQQRGFAPAWQPEFHRGRFQI
jgi:hypothetical protein